MTQQDDIKAAAARVLARHTATTTATTAATREKKIVARAGADARFVQQGVPGRKGVVAFDAGRARGAVERLAAERERRRQAVLKILDANSGIRYAWITDDKEHPEFVILVVAIRDAGTCELSIPRERYDGLELVKLLERSESGAQS